LAGLQPFPDSPPKGGTSNLSLPSRLRGQARHASLRPMKLFIACLCLFFFLNVSANANAAARLQHVVCFKFKSTASKDDIKKVEDAFGELKKKVPEVKSFEWGTNVSPEQRNKGFTHCFVLSFDSDKDRDTYLEHPEHKAFGKLVGPVLEDVFVIDFWAKP
jgi:hypothetical protein